ncbi:universal stress protein [Galbibacter sp. EGI 63066]|uniref:universal stress protein n=1 Tax=Galbibacter sp. EGI 63066 TaxID=2993559 RepID=UPI002248AC13|nr:universal stress protein [Galbibacter sp. EGI 63066]MCX2681718.1 universal stress protein [Galbibacter sp. EGI 63066]
MKRVLIAIDYNPTSEKVVEEGYKLAKTLGAEVCLLHVIGNLQFYGIQYPRFMGHDSMNYALNPDFQEEMKDVAKVFLDNAVKHLNDDTVTSHISEGDTAKEILQYAKDWQASLIVMGTHSHSKLEKILMGTVASSVLERTETPVYMVPVKP